MEQDSKVSRAGWASRQAGGGPEMEKTEQSIQRWRVKPPRQVGHSAVPEITQDYGNPWVEWKAGDQ